MIQQSPGLMCTVGLAILTFALTVSATTETDLHGTPHDPTILQVTDNPILYPRKFLNSALSLLGTEDNFKIFVKKYNKEYATRKEYMHRLGIFAKNMIRAIEHQALDPTAVHGVTPFMDLTPEEFERMYTGALGGGAHVDGVVEEEDVASFVEASGLPKSFDWRKKGAVTAVKMQVRFNFIFRMLIS